MADEWINFDEHLYENFRKASAVETLAAHHQMNADSLELTGGALRAVKFGTVYGINHEDLSDPVAAEFVLQQIQADWGTKMGVFLDNLCLASDRFEHEEKVFEGSVVPAEQRVTSLNNLVQSRFHVSRGDEVLPLLEGLAAYAKKPHALHKHQDAHLLDYRPGIIAHPAFRKVLFGDDKPEGIPLVNDVPIKWSIGCRYSEEASNDPTGNPLMFIGNVNALKLGIRSGPESTMMVASMGEAALKIRARRGFLVEPGNQFHVIELVD